MPLLTSGAEGHWVHADRLIVLDHRLAVDQEQLKRWRAIGDQRCDRVGDVARIWMDAAKSLCINEACQVRRPPVLTRSLNCCAPPRQE